jgi:hypothetical protein
MSSRPSTCAEVVWIDNCPETRQTVEEKSSTITGIRSVQVSALVSRACLLLIVVSLLFPDADDGAVDSLFLHPVSLLPVRGMHTAGPR